MSGLGAECRRGPYDVWSLAAAGAAAAGRAVVATVWPRDAVGRPVDAAAAGLAAFVEEAKATGFVADALARHQIQGAIVAPAQEAV